MVENLLKGMKILDLKKHIDERGFFCELLREDWDDLTKGDKIVQISLSMSHPGVVRAWHRHLRGQIDYIVVIKGAVKVCAFDEETGELSEVVLRGDKLQILRIDGKHWHGTKNIGDGPSLTLYATTKLYDYQKPDEERLPPNTEKIIDPRTRKSYKW
jgi:dTDP-4-dehydrorhamnose 3,5-epimerase